MFHAKLRCRQSSLLENARRIHLAARGRPVSFRRSEGHVQKAPRDADSEEGTAEILNLKRRRTQRLEHGGAELSRERGRGDAQVIPAPSSHLRLNLKMGA